MINRLPNGHIAIGAPNSDIRKETEKCPFEWDGEYHSCPTCNYNGRRMNCKLCFRDKCDNPKCPIK